MDANDPCELPAARSDSGAGLPAEPPVHDKPDGAPPPRLGIIHFLAWLTVAAVLFGTERSVQLIEMASSHPDTFLRHYLALDTIRLIAVAAGVVGLAALVRWRVRGKPFPLAPGHWILAAEIIPMLLNYGIETARRLIVSLLGVSPAQASYLPALAISALLAMAQMFAFAIAARRCEEKGGWQWIFGVLGVACAAQVTMDAILFLVIAGWFRPPFTLFDFFYPAPAVVQSVASSITIIFAAYDASRVRRDWLHGLGIGLVFVNALMWVGYWVATWYFR